MVRTDFDVVSEGFILILSFPSRYKVFLSKHKAAARLIPLSSRCTADAFGSIARSNIIEFLLRQFTTTQLGLNLKANRAMVPDCSAQSAVRLTFEPAFAVGR